MEWSNIISFGIAGIGATVLALSPALNVSTSSSNPAPVATESSSPTAAPRRLTVTVKVAEPEDLKVQEGDTIKAGDVIADRERERKRLTSQKQQLQLSLQRLKAAFITPPAAPRPVPAVNALPPTSYLEHQAEIEKAKAAIAQCESEIELKNQEIAYLKELSNLDPIILEHEQVKLAQLKQKHTAAVREYQLAVGKLQSAKDNREYQKYQASVNAARRVEEFNQARLNYQRQLAEYEQRLADREFQITQLQVRLDDVSNAIASLSVVKAPYSGTVRRVKWLGQSPDGSLSAEITLMVRNSQQSTVNSQQ